jgi:two-component system, LuxR family, sensor kinase FixL
MKGSRRLLEGNTDERSALLREAMDKAAGQAMRAGQIIRRLRDFVARGETEREMESISKLVEEASALALVGAKELGIRVRYKFDRNADLVLADKVQIQQVLLNLIRNAIDAMSESPQRDLTISIVAADNAMVKRRLRTRDPASPTTRQPSFSALLYDQGARNGGGPVDLQDDHRRPWRTDRHPANPGGGTVFYFTLPAVKRRSFADAK